VSDEASAIVAICFTLMLYVRLCSIAMVFNCTSANVKRNILDEKCSVKLSNA